MINRRIIRDHLRNVDDIHGIMNSMKTLAYMETQKLDRLLTTQHAVVSGIEEVASDFANNYLTTLPEIQPGYQIYILIGSERGFCGDYNEQVIRELERIRQQRIHSSVTDMISVGHRLQPLLHEETCDIKYLDGVSVVDEVETALSRVVDSLTDLQTRHGSLTLSAIYHAGDSGNVVTRKLLPPFQEYLDKPKTFSNSPDLNLEPADFLVELSDHYLYAILHEIFYTSLLAENHRRVQHLEGAVRRLDEKSDKLKRQYNARRQEEIIEEIEVILLSSASLESPNTGQ